MDEQWSAFAPGWIDRPRSRGYLRVKGPVVVGADLYQSARDRLDPISRYQRNKFPVPLLSRRGTIIVRPAVGSRFYRLIKMQSENETAIQMRLQNRSSLSR